MSARVRRPARRLPGVVAGVVVPAVVLAGCAAPPALDPGGERLRVVTTTTLLADLVRQVGGERVEVVPIVPEGADPHTYEPTLRDARDVVYADVAFSNYALLEEHAVITTLDANLRDDAVQVSLAEESVKYAAEIIPLVEDVGLDSLWLGLRVQGDGAERGATRASQVLVQATGADGPGEVYAYLTGTFGDTDVYVDSSDGFDAADGYRHDTLTLPVDAHTHLSWAFTEPGVYRLDLRARLQPEPTARPLDVGSGTLTVAVGVPPSAAGVADPVVLDAGHADVTTDLATGTLLVRHEPEASGDAPTSDHAHVHEHALDDVVVVVPTTSLAEVPAGPAHRFLGRPGTLVHQLPQAVLGKHVHGEIDPHLWQDVGNAMAYAQLVRDTLASADPDGARHYRGTTAAYLDELAAADAYVQAQVDAIPPDRRYLVTTHDAFGYLAHAYGLTVAGFVSPNPAVEPSLADRRRLTQTLRSLQVPAVFLEPNLVARSSTLTQVADEVGVQVCPLYGDTFDEHVTTYVQMVRANADSLRRCLTAAPTP